MEIEYIIPIVVSLCVLIVALIIFFSKPKKEVERQQIGFLKTNIQLLKIKNNKTSEEINREIKINFIEAEKAINENKGLTNNEIIQIADYFQLDKMILIYHDLREEYDEKWKKI